MRLTTDQIREAATAVILDAARDMPDDIVLEHLEEQGGDFDFEDVAAITRLCETAEIVVSFDAAAWSATAMEG